ncbi:hypothetical protein K493DRAFT_313444 [Basidiobolus meristosporus CBS 931.73]|uniref:Required for respiratory growth protein 9, mitochondrial n=1 Tax=Basidiobolus meristosporus CBS 931.73 TaxID=1314790 RepID=A0A1Y1YLN5_9FUNG|nr:hypothetical protein K493DRAFT_313444 [Basidiobolus meristosporus CBS 931.73]|eukprot:ORX98912.1 hypothetical protein K493DRAFT_313444 [Basidiobolus meristosporus CBS 931.73]
MNTLCQRSRVILPNALSWGRAGVLYGRRCINNMPNLTDSHTEEKEPPKPRILDTLTLPENVTSKSVSWLEDRLLSSRNSTETSRRANRDKLVEEKVFERLLRKEDNVRPPRPPKVEVHPSMNMDAPAWARRKMSVEKSLQGNQWNPAKKVARSTMEKIRFLKSELPDEWPIDRISKEFKISFEAVRRILRSKYQPSPEVLKRQEERRLQQRLDYVRSVKDESTTKQRKPTLRKIEIPSN